MATRSTADERIAVLVESRADVTGFRQARAENSALGREAKATADNLKAAGAQGTTAQRSLADAARTAASEQQKVTVTAEQSRAMWQRAGGDYSRFLELVRQHVAEQKSLAAATAQATAAMQQQQAASGRVVGSIGPGGVTMPGQVNAELERIPNKARTAANALSTVAFAAAGAGGGAQSLAIAAGTAASSLASLTNSASIAAGAAGFGAIVTVLGTAILLLDRFEKRAKAIDLVGMVGEMSDAAFAAREADLAARVGRQQHRARLTKDAANATLPFDPITGPAIRIGLEVAARHEQKVLEDLLEQQSRLREEGIERARQKGKEASAERQRQEEEDLERSKTLLDELANAHLDMYGKRTLSAETFARMQVERQFVEHKAEIEALQIHEDQKTSLVAAAARVRAEALLRIEQDARAKAREAENRELDAAAKEQERRLDRVTAAMRDALVASIEGESLGKAFNRIAGRAIVDWLSMKAIQHSISALANAAFGLWGHAAKDAAVAAAATAGAHQVAQIAGISSRGGSSVASGPSLSNRDPNDRGGNVTVVIQTVDPTSREVLGQTAWYLERSGVMKRPRNIPTTTSPVASLAAFVA